MQVSHPVSELCAFTAVRAAGDVMVTACPELYVPATGLNVGVAAGRRLMVYAALLTGESINPVPPAMV
jgi:hypothetical protein